MLRVSVIVLVKIEPSDIAYSTVVTFVMTESSCEIADDEDQLNHPFGASGISVSLAANSINKELSITAASPL